MGVSKPPIFSERYREGWVDGVRYCVARMADGDALEEIERAALAVAAQGEKKRKRYERRRRMGDNG